MTLGGTHGRITVWALLDQRVQLLLCQSPSNSCGLDIPISQNLQDERVGTWQCTLVHEIPQLWCCLWNAALPKHLDETHLPMSVPRNILPRNSSATTHYPHKDSPVSFPSQKRNSICDNRPCSPCESRGRKNVALGEIAKSGLKWSASKCQCRAHKQHSARLRACLRGLLG
jgi:hypothetical protein